MTATETETELEDEIIVALSDYLDGALPAARVREVEDKLATDAQWKTAHAELLETRDALSGLQKARAPESFAQDVTTTINKRSAGRFFGRRTLGDRVPLGALLVVALIGLSIIAYVMWTSQTGSLRVTPDPKAPPPSGSAFVDPP